METTTGEKSALFLIRRPGFAVTFNSLACAQLAPDSSYAFIILLFSNFKKCLANKEYLTELRAAFAG